MDDRHSINEDQIAHDKHDRPKSDDIIAKVEELGQRSAPPAATAEQEGTVCMVAMVADVLTSL